MQAYNFQHDLIKAYPILSETRVLLTNKVDPYMVQNTITKNILPSALSMLGTKLKLSLITVSILQDIAYWDLIFTYPTDYNAQNLLDRIYNQVIQLDDSFDHSRIGESGICKISFKVG